jgi:DHA1 family bicyclomycin/chloramphenicol resistance-like MFS transporter
MQFSEKTGMSFREYVVLMAMLMSLVALSIDSMLPALLTIGKALQVKAVNDVQYIIGSLFAGLTLGQLLSGPLSDSYGRKPVLFAGLGLFMAGSLLCIIAQDFNHMLAGRFLQGTGVAAPRILTVAVTRDLFAGREMARVMSIIMGVFIFVPVLAPAVGQLMLQTGYWQAIFVMLMAWGLCGGMWARLRLPETLPKEKRRPLSLSGILRGAGECLRHRVTRNYTLCAGLVFACLVSYINTSAQIFQVYFAVGEWFPLCFALSALSIGVASFINSAIVRRYGMRHITHYALKLLLAVSVACLTVLLLNDGEISLYAFMAFSISAFFCCGMVFGNINALAMEPMGHIAGIASAVVGTLSSAVSLVIGTAIGQLYTHSPLPLVTGYAVIALLALAVQWQLRHAPVHPAEEDGQSA